MALITKGTPLLVFREERLQLPKPYQYFEIIENENICYMIPQYNRHFKG